MQHGNASQYSGPSGYKRNEDTDERSWRPLLFSDEDAQPSDRRRNTDEFEGTNEFTSCLRSLKCDSDMSERFVKMRVLWELQNHLQTNLLSNGGGPSSAEALASMFIVFSRSMREG